MPGSAISWINNAKLLAVSTPTYSASVDPTYPITNILDPDPSRVARFNYAVLANGYQFVVIDLGGTLAGPFRAFAVLNCRLVASGTGGFFRIAFTDAAQSFYYGSLDIPLSSLVPIPGTVDRYDLIGLLPSDVTCNKIELRFVPGSIASGANYFEVGYVWAGPAVVFPLGCDAGWSVEPVDPSEVSRGRGGALSATKLPTRSKLVLPFSVQTYAQMLGTAGNPSAPSIYNLLREAGLSSPVLVVHNSSDAHAVQRLSVYGAVTQMPRIQQQSSIYYQTSLEVEQIR